MVVESALNNQNTRKLVGFHILDSNLLCRVCGQSYWAKRNKLCVLTQECLWAQTPDIRVSCELKIQLTLDIRVSCELKVQRTLDIRVSCDLKVQRTLDIRVSSELKVQRTLDIRVYCELKMQRTLDIRVSCELKVQRTLDIRVSSELKMQRTLDIRVSCELKVQRTLDIRVSSELKVQRTLDTLVLRKFGALLFVLGSQATLGTIVSTCKFGTVTTSMAKKLFTFFFTKMFLLNLISVVLY